MGKDRKISDSILEWLMALNGRSGKISINDESFFEALANEPKDNKKEFEESHDSKILKWLESEWCFMVMFISGFYKSIRWLVGFIITSINCIAKRLKKSVRNNKLYQKLYNTLFYKKSFRFVIIAATFFFICVFTVHFAIVFIKDVILYDTEINVNEQGALNPRKALNCEHAIYLFNPSEVWANTGVRLNKGDRYRINISGGSYSTVYETVRAAKDNVKPFFDKVRLDSPYNLDKIEPTITYCLSKGALHLGSDNKVHKFGFGTVMYTIQPEAADLKYNPLSVPACELRSWDPGNINKRYDQDRAFHNATSSGYLYLAVNDIVFGDYNDSLSQQGRSESYAKEINKYGYRPKADALSSIKQYVDADIEYFSNKAKQAKSYVDTEKLKRELVGILKNDYSYFYRDNDGQIMVSVEIQRREPWAFFKPLMAYRTFETRVTELPEASINASWLVKALVFIWSIFVFLFWLIVFIGHILVLYAIGAIKLWVIIIILFIIADGFQHLFFGGKETTT